MINLCWFEDGEWKQLELHHGNPTREEVVRIEKLGRKLGQPIAFLEHPVTFMLIPLFDTLLPVRRELSSVDNDDSRMIEALARFIDSQDRSHRALDYISYRLQRADLEAEIARLEARLDTAVEMLNEEPEGPD
jgi:hypothetical protein